MQAVHTDDGAVTGCLARGGELAHLPATDPSSPWCGRASKSVSPVAQSATSAMGSRTSVGREEGGACLGIVRQQHLAADRQTGGQLDQQVGLLLGKTEHPFPGQQAVAVALAGGAGQVAGYGRSGRARRSDRTGRRGPAPACSPSRAGLRGGFRLGMQGTGLLVQLVGHRLLGTGAEQAIHVERATGLGPVPESPSPPKGCTPTTAPTMLRLT